MGDGDHDSSQNGTCPADVLLLKFEKLHRNAPASCGAVRLASKKCKVLVDPIFYRHLKLHEALVKCFDVDDEPNVSQDVADARRRVRLPLTFHCPSMYIRKLHCFFYPPPPFFFQKEKENFTSG